MIPNTDSLSTHDQFTSIDNQAYGEVRIYQGLVEPLPSVSKILVGHGTPLACTSCHRIGMPIYYLKRYNGLYEVLCFDNGKGCWEHSSRSLCSYVDIEAAQCTDVAEWKVTYGSATELSVKTVCSRHIAAVLGNAPSYNLYPLDRD